jgi:2'-5' RNA ligase
MRCFLAINLNEEAREELSKVIKNLEKNEFFLGKSVEKENLHMTLKFFAELKDNQVNTVRERLKSLKSKKIQVRLGKIGIFPSENFIRVVWVALEPEYELKKLNNDISFILEKLDPSDDDLEFKPHITLARMQNMSDKQAFAKYVREIKIKPVSFQVDSVVLKKSTLTEKGPIYEDVFKIELN